MIDTMILHCISDDSEYFLFEDTVNQNFMVCTLEDKLIEQSKVLVKRPSMVIDEIRKNNVIGYE